MLNKVYSDKIIRYAAEIPLQIRLDSPNATASKRSNFCGSHIAIDIMTKEGKITQFGQTIDACALGSAASSIVSAYIIGATFDEVIQAQIEMHNMLTQNGHPPKWPFCRT